MIRRHSVRYYDDTGKYRWLHEYSEMPSKEELDAEIIDLANKGIIVKKVEIEIESE